MFVAPVLRRRSKAKFSPFFLTFTLSSWLLMIVRAASPAHAATFTVTNVNDSGAGSLRQAIIDSNITPNGPHTIAFNIGGAMGVKTISPVLQYPTIASLGLTIDGTTQPGYAGAPLIEINGTNAGANVDGFLINNHQCSVKGLIINRYGGNGLTVHGQNVTVQGCYIGTNAAGNTDLGNGKNGIWVRSDSVTIGGTTAAARNVISGNNLDGILVEHTDPGGDSIQGNYIGTDAAGTLDLGNSANGIQVKAINVLIGGTSAAARNIISGNNAGGVRLEGSTSSGNLVQGNYIGTNKNGTAGVGNSSSGILCNNAPNNTFGGTSSAARNIISGNGAVGVFITGASANGNVVSANFIGIDALGTTAIANGGSGVLIDTGSNNFVGGATAGERNIISGNTTYGVVIRAGAAGNVVQNNFIGTNSAGAVVVPNGQAGVWITTGANNNTIGSTNGAARNIISGNGSHGVWMTSNTTQNNTVLGNFIGTNLANTAVLPNAGDGVNVAGAPNNMIGGTTAGAGNVISGNGLNGINISQSASTNTIQGNLIGTNLTGTTDLGNAGRGIVIADTSGTIVGGTATSARNIISGNDNIGIDISGTTATNNTIAGNYIGTNKGGTTALGNDSINVLINGAPGNTIGGLTNGASNVISGAIGIGNEGFGIYILGDTATGNLVQGNKVGTNAAGTDALANGNNGIRVEDADNNTIGGTTAAARNIISGNTVSGIRITGTATGNTVQGNYIGTKTDGVGALGNGGAGVVISGSGANTIGGAGAGAGNIIAFNSNSGVAISSSAGNAVIDNRIFSNGGLGIDLGTSGVTLNDSGDGDTGGNNLQNFPLLTQANTTGSSILLYGTINSTANSDFRIDFYDNVNADASGYGEGQNFVGAWSATTDASGNATFSIPFAVAIPAGHFISATATNLTTQDTSEFSPAAEVTAITLESASNNSPANATPLDVATYPMAVVIGSVNPAADVDYYKFTVPANTWVWALVDTGGQQNGISTSRDSVLTLLAPDGTTIIELDDDDGTGTGGDTTIETASASAIGGRALLAAGTYYLKVQEFGDNGVISPYRLFVAVTNSASSESEGNDSVATANALVTPANPKAVVAGAIGAAGDVDYYAVQANAGNTIFINADGDPERDGVGTDLAVDLINPAGNVVLLTANSSGAGTAGNPPCEAFDMSITTSGTFYVRVRHNAGGTGTYQLMVTANNGQNQLGYKVVGRVYLSDGTGIPNVTVTRTGSATAVLTNSSGYYTFTNVPNGSVTITPTLSGYTFAPVSRTVTVNGADITNQNFVGSSGFSIKGRIYRNDSTGIENVSVTRTGSATPVFTNSAGYYTFINVPDGNYTITPTLSGYGFSPATRSVTVTGADAINQNFVGSTGYIVAGRVTTSANIGVSGVSVARTGSATTAITNSAGYYTFYDVPNGDYVLTPSKSGSTFIPTNKNVTVAGANLSGQNFIASP